MTRHTTGRTLGVEGLTYHQLDLTTEPVFFPMFVKLVSRHARNQSQVWDFTEGYDFIHVNGMLATCTYDGGDGLRECNARSNSESLRITLFADKFYVRHFCTRGISGSLNKIIKNLPIPYISIAGVQICE